MTLEHYAVADTLAAALRGLHPRGVAQAVRLGVRLGAVLQPVPLAAARRTWPSTPRSASGCSPCPGCCCCFSRASIVASYWIHRDVEGTGLPEQAPGLPGAGRGAAHPVLLAGRGRVRKRWSTTTCVSSAAPSSGFATRCGRGTRNRWPTSRARHRARRAPERLAYVGEALGQRAAQLLRVEGAARTGDARGRGREDRVAGAASASPWPCCWRVVLTLPLLVPVHELEAVKHWVEDPWIHGFIMIAIVTLAVTAGLRHGYNQQMARSEHAKQFGRMSELFDAAQTHLASSSRPAKSNRRRRC